MVSVSLFAGRVSQDDAALVANNFMRGSVAASGASKAPAKKMVLKKAASEQENRYYVYEYENGEGWVVVAANDAITPILAYSKTGHFRTDNQPANVRNWFDQYDNFIKKVEADGAEPTEEAKAMWDRLRKGLPDDPAGEIIVDMLVQTQWDQDSPYWNLCPGSGNTKAYTGCVATAMAQVMKYWEWPIKGTGEHSYRPLYVNNPEQYSRYPVQTAKFGETTYDWANMKNTYTGSETSAQKTAVATLMFHCGVATDMMYGSDSDGGSGTGTVNYGDWDWGIKTTDEGGCAQNALYAFFKYKKPTGYMRDGLTDSGVTYYEKWSDENWTNMIKTELDKYHPIMYGGANSNQEGHSFICDGYTDLDYFHFNWGWSGSNDGWYILNNLKPGSGGAGGGSYDFTVDHDVLIGIVPDKTWPKYAVTWSVDGEETVVNAEEHSQIVLPATPEACASGKVFVGWTKQSTLDGTKPADLMTKARGIVMEPVTYYAVFANEEADGITPATTTYTFTSKAWATSQSAWTSVQQGSQYSSSQGVQVTRSTPCAGAKTKNNVNNVSKVVVTYSTTSSNGAGVIKVTVGSVGVAKEVTKTGGTTARTLEFPFEDASGQVSFTVNCTTNSIYVKSVAITTGGGTVYSDYSLDCGTAEPCTHSITIQKDTPENGTFALDKTGEQESCKKLVVKVNNIAPATGYKFKEIKQTGITSGVTIDQSAKTVTYDKDIDGTSTINVLFEALPTYTIRFFNNGEQIGEAQSVIEGQSPVVPANPTTTCTDYTFVGWWTSTLPANNETAHTWITNFAATKDQDYHAIFKKTEIEEGGSAAFDGSTPGTYKIYVQAGDTKYFAKGSINSSNKLESTTNETEAAEFTFAKVSGGFTISVGGSYLKYNGNSTNVGLGNTAYTWDITASTAGFGSWRATASTATNRALVLRKTNNYQSFGAYATSNINGTEYFDIEIGDSGPASTTYYSSIVSCSTEAIDHIQTGEKAVKVLENGMVVIIRGNEKYSIFGQKIK